VGDGGLIGSPTAVTSEKGPRKVATLEDILQINYPGALWTFATANTYSTLSWDPANAQAKPTLATLQGLSAAADTTLAARTQAETQQGQLAPPGAPDGILRALEALTARLDEASARVLELDTAVAEIRTKLKATSLNTALTAVLTTSAFASTGFAALKSRLVAIRAGGTGG
jgi:hypothetical protein